MGVLEWAQRILVGEERTRTVPKGRRSLSAPRKKKRILALIARDSDRCWYCWRTFDDELFRTIDHVIPVAAGGTNKIENLRLSCYPCNQVKGVRQRDYRPGCFRNLYREPW